MGGSAFASLQQLPIQINIKGTNLADLTKASEDVKAALLTVSGLVDINSDNRPPKPEIQIRVDRERAARLGAGTAVIAGAMRSLVDGDLASKYREGEKLDRHPRPGLGGHPGEPGAVVADQRPLDAGRDDHPGPGRDAPERQRPDPDPAVQPDPPDHDRGQHPQRPGPQRDHPEGQRSPGRRSASPPA